MTSGMEPLFPVELLSAPDAGPREIVPGAIHVPSWLDPAEQSWIADRYREWAAGPVPPRAAMLPGGHPMSVQTVCLGWHWQPYRYTREAFDVNGRRVLDFPDWMVRLGRKALASAGASTDAAAAYAPDTALVNFYDHAAKVGMHQDKEERSTAPVVSLSIGDSCVFRFGNTEGRGKPYTEVLLRSGDLFVFGGPSRFAYHGVVKVHPGTAPANCGLESGRINITMRVTGMS